MVKINFPLSNSITLILPTTNLNLTRQNIIIIILKVVNIPELY